MTSEDELKLAELLCARLCHDLSGPIAGASAGAELLADEATPDPDTAALVADSVAAATRLLRVLRAALGAGTQPFATTEFQTLARSIFPDSGATRLTLALETDAASWDRRAGKLLLNLLMVARDALPRGGSVTARLAAQPLAITVVAEGAQLATEEAATAFAADSPATLGARGGQAFYAARLAAALGRSIAVSQSAGRFEVTVG